MLELAHNGSQECVEQPLLGKALDTRRNGFGPWIVMFYHCFGEARGVTLPARWNEKIERLLKGCGFSSRTDS